MCNYQACRLSHRVRKRAGSDDLQAVANQRARMESSHVHDSSRSVQQT